MAPVTRLIKQIIIAVIVLIILWGIGWGFMRIFVPAPPTPTPDIGTRLQPITFITSQLFSISRDQYDFYARVRNLNADYGSGDVEYQLIGYYDQMDGNESTVVLQTGSFYILPGQTKYIVVSPLISNQQLTKVDLHIVSVNWQEVDPLISRGANLVIVNPKYVPQSASGVFSKAGGSVVNNSDFDINRADITVVAYDSSNDPIAVGKTDVRTFLAHTTRGFEVAWYAPFSGTVARVDAEAQFNVFENDALIRTYGGTERFQEMY